LRPPLLCVLSSRVRLSLFDPRRGGSLGEGLHRGLHLYLHRCPAPRGSGDRWGGNWRFPFPSFPCSTGHGGPAGSAPYPVVCRLVTPGINRAPDRSPAVSGGVTVFPASIAGSGPLCSCTPPKHAPCPNICSILGAVRAAFPL